MNNTGLIADLFRRIEMVEAWGRGMPLIRKNAPSVTFKEIAGIFIVGFTRPSFLTTQETSVKEGVITSVKASGGAKANTMAKTGVKPLVEPSVKARVKTSVKILKLLEANPAMTLAEIAVVVGKTLRAVELASSKLVKTGHLRYVGSPKTGHWEVLP